MSYDCHQKHCRKRFCAFCLHSGRHTQRGNGGIKHYNKFNDYYSIPVIDRKNGFAFRIRLKDDNSLVELRKLSDVKNGVNKVLGKVIIPNDLIYLQGFIIEGYDLY
ncbi:phage baseplate protein [Bacillus cabrialesii]|uniref:phage baseplate protein n=1 Tax=Bacillus cabrialesii TaxID=2487276 RepID=UPI0030050BB3